MVVAVVVAVVVVAVVAVVAWVAVAAAKKLKKIASKYGALDRDANPELAFWNASRRRYGRSLSDL